MKKIIIGTAAGLMLLLLSACGFQKIASRPETTSKTNKKETSVDNSTSISISDALNSGKKMRCTFTLKDQSAGSQIQYTMYTDGAKNSKVQFNMKTGDKTLVVNSLFLSNNGGEIYNWNEGEKVGTKYTVDCMKQLTQNLPQEQQKARPTTDPEEAYKDAMDVQCSPVDSVETSIPSDVAFSDQCKALNDIIKKMPNISNMPKDIQNIP